MHTADQQYGPCSCQDDGRCLYVNGGPACMNEQQGAPTPRVDALLLEVDEGRVYKDYGPTVDLARQLERELIAKTAEAERLREALETILWRPLGESARIARAALAATRKEDSDG